MNNFRSRSVIIDTTSYSGEKLVNIDQGSEGDEKERKKRKRKSKSKSKSKEKKKKKRKSKKKRGIHIRDS